MRGDGLGELIAALLLISILCGLLYLEIIDTTEQDNQNALYEIDNLNEEIAFWKDEHSTLEDDLWAEKQKPPENEIVYVPEYIKLPPEIIVRTDFYLPTKIEIKRILRHDDTDENEWSKQYDCTEFSGDVIALLYSKGIFSCMVEIDYYDGKDYGHHFVAVNTTEGIIYIEPQNDKMFDFISLESNYCDKVNWDCDRTIKKISSCYE